MRELARRDAEELVPRPEFPVFGLAAPVLAPAALAQFQQMNGAWTSVTLAYGSWEAAAGPYVAVTCAAADSGPLAAPADGPAGMPGRGTEAELLRAIDAERNRVAAHAGVDGEEPAEPPRYSREQLPAGDALVCRHGTVWALRLLPGTMSGATVPGVTAPGVTAPGVTVTVTGRGADPEAVRLERVRDLRPLFEARNEILGRLVERRRRESPVLEPAEGIAAFRALADFTLAANAEVRAAADARRAPRHRAGWGGMHNALWQRAVRELQRMAGVGKRAADDVVTSVVNHLGHLAEQAPWFTADTRLREAAIDETLRHAVLGENVPSLPAQRAWARYWSAHMARLRREPGREPGAAGALADHQARQALSTGWLAAWSAWATGA